nr:unnamed protein product [Callosobruchus chinensis]
MYTMLYFAIYLQKRMTWNGSTLLKHTLQFLGVLSAVFTAMTRVSDYKHHWSDVLCGLLLGALVASVTGSLLRKSSDPHEKDSYNVQKPIVGSDNSGITYSTFNRSAL